MMKSEYYADNLNNVVIDGSRGMNNWSAKFEYGDGTIIESVFKNLDSRLIELIREFKDGVIVGCVAWLTHEEILAELSNCLSVQILVQKEDFLRPDINVNKKTWNKKLQTLYGSLSCKIHKSDLGGIASGLSVGHGSSLKPLRCVGNYNSDKHPASPRSHHKFLVFCTLTKDTYIGKYGSLRNDSVKGINYDDYFSISEYFTPKAVWTGSFNFTKNATMSLENAIIIRNDLGNNPIIDSYFRTYREVLTISEELNWDVEWCNPEYRIGT